MISLNTIALKEALSKCGKCAKNDKTAPLTQLINIKTKDSHTLVFTSTDERNTFSYFLRDDTAEFESIDICVLIDQITKLVSKFNCTNTQISISNSIFLYPPPYYGGSINFVIPFVTPRNTHVRPNKVYIFLISVKF